MTKSLLFDKMYKELNNPLSTIGGYADFTQTDPREYKKLNKDECIFKLDSTTDLNKIEIGDMGILFVLISKDDIKKCKFEKALVDWDCY